jgi:hypothetical protein
LNNTLRRCSQAFELSPQGANTGGLSGCVFAGNICSSMGYNWAQQAHFAGQWAHLISYYQQVPCDLQITGNVFCYSFGNYQSIVSPAPFQNNYSWHAGVVVDNNVIALKPNQVLQYQYPYTLSQSASFVSAAGQDVHSKFLALPASITTPAAADSYARRLAATYHL